MKILGSEFKITVAAYKHISEIIDYARRDAGDTARYCFISWGDTGVDDAESIPGPSLAFDPTDMGLGKSPNFYLIEGNKVAIGLDRRRVQEFRDKILDYRSGRLVLMYLDDLI
ncbi:MAG: hypothetical protein LCH86_02235 [Proteobacteria bacterium]|nr:hypothetical protein [Pseudomonadota bacterium]